MNMEQDAINLEAFGLSDVCSIAKGTALDKSFQIHESALHSSDSLMEDYLRQVIPVLQTCATVLYEITKRDLLLHCKHPEDVDFSIPVHIIPHVVEVDNENQQSHIPCTGVIKTDKEALLFMEFVKVYNEKITGLVVKALDVEKDGIMSKRITNYTESKNGFDEFTKVLEKIIAFYTAKLLGFSPTVELPLLEDVKNMMEKLCCIKSKLKEEEFSTFLADNDSGFNTSKEVILCKIVGLCEDYGDHLFGMDGYMHQTIQYFVEWWIHCSQRRLRADGILWQSSKQYLVENLQKVGFNQQTAEIISESISQDVVSLQKPSFWATRYLDHVFEHHPLLSNSSRYPEHENILDEWFEVKLPLNRSLEPSVPLDVETSTVRMINVSFHDQGKAVVEKFLKEQTEDTDYKLLYHGTTHESAISLVAHGIHIGKGSRKQDFSDRRGFYLSFEFENARVWSKAGRGNHQAIVVYKVNCSLLNGNSGLDLCQDRSLWEKVVRHCRKGSRNEWCQQMFDRYGFIKGPVCKNPENAGKNEPLQCFEEAGIQLCICNEDFATEFGGLNNIACVIFY